jgi:hypothetical protein
MSSVNQPLDSPDYLALNWLIHLQVPQRSKSVRDRKMKEEQTNQRFLRSVRKLNSNYNAFSTKPQISN